jgi:amidase
MSVTLLDTFASATQMLQALQNRKISSVELLEIHLAQIAQFNPHINAIITPNNENAKQMAQDADQARTQGDESVLLGLPVTFKDCISVSGLRSTMGVAEYRDHIPEHEAVIASRVKRAGAIVLGKTNIPPWADDWQTDNAVFGRTSNPWNLDYTSGGSTGGGAAALAAGLTPLEFGSDMAGSIRVPAAFCGVYGHRPSETALPQTGGNPWWVLPNPTLAFAVQGPLARYAEDLELALDVTAGADQGEDVAWQLHIPAARHKRLQDFRIALLPSIDWLPVEPDIIQALHSFMEKLAQIGITVTEVQPQWGEGLRDYYKLFLSMINARYSLGMDEETRDNAIAELRLKNDEFANAEAAGYAALASDYIGWFTKRENYRAAFRAFFKEWDVLIAPANMVTAFRHSNLPWQERFFNIDDQSVSYNKQMVYASIATLSGQPSTVFPIGFNNAGLPIGIQAIGPYLEDRTSIRFTQLYAQEFGGFQPPVRT